MSASQSPHSDRSQLERNTETKMQELNPRPCRFRIKSATEFFLDVEFQQLNLDDGTLANQATYMMEMKSSI